MAQNCVLPGYCENCRKIKKETIVLDLPKSTPDYKKGFEDGRKYALKLVQRYAQDGILTEDIKKLIDTLLKD